MGDMRTKDDIRKEIWTLLEEKDIARFPRPVHGRIPNFDGAELAAARLSRTEEWKRAKVIKSNPDSPQRRVRELALRHRKTVYMAVPRLREMRCFVELKLHRLRGLEDRAVTIKGAFRHGKKVLPSEMRKVDLIMAGSVAVNRSGARVGKGGGYSDLEFALALEMDLIDDSTVVTSTVHGLQVIEDDIPMTEHDLPVDLIVTPDESITTGTAFPRPKGIMWDHLTDEKIGEIPILQQLLQQQPQQQQLQQPWRPCKK